MGVEYLDEEKPAASAASSAVEYIEDSPKASAAGSAAGGAPQDLNLLDKIFNVPGAAVRSAIQGTGYAYGAQNPNSIPKFQEQALEGYYDKVDTSKEIPFAVAGPVGAPRATVGFGVSAAGLAADVATNPAEVAGLLLPELPIGKGNTLGSAIMKSPIGKFLTKERHLFRKPLPDVTERFPTVSGAMKSESAASRNSVADVNTRERAFLTEAESTHKYNTEQLKAERVKLGQDYAKSARETVLNTRQKAVDYTRKFYAGYGERLNTLKAKQALVPEEAHQFIETLKQRGAFGVEGPSPEITRYQTRLVNKANDPGDLMNRPGTANIQLDSLLSDLGFQRKGAYKSGPFTPEEHKFYVMNEAVGDLLEAKGVTGMAELKGEYRNQFAPLRNTLFKIIDPYAKGGQYDTSAGVRLLTDFAQGKVKPDDAAFLQVYSERIDPELGAAARVGRERFQAHTAQENLTAQEYGGLVQTAKKRAENERLGIMQTTAQKIDQLITQGRHDEALKLIRNVVFGAAATIPAAIYGMKKLSKSL